MLNILYISSLSLDDLYCYCDRFNACKCGNLIQDNDSYCGKCGKKVESWCQTEIKWNNIFIEYCKDYLQLPEHIKTNTTIDHKTIGHTFNQHNKIKLFKKDNAKKNTIYDNTYFGINIPNGINCTVNECEKYLTKLENFINPIHKYETITLKWQFDEEEYKLL